MTYHPKRHHRRSIRLRGYNYAQPGAYFLMLITENRANLFGEIVRGQMRLSAAGEVVSRCWHDIPKHFPHAVLDTFQVMPNHVHGVLVFSRPGRPSPRTLQAGERPRGTSMTVGSVVRGFKIGVTKWMRQHTRVHDVWHRNYWEHIVRNPAELARIRRYIINNPMQWELDRMNAANDRKYRRGPTDWQPPVHRRVDLQPDKRQECDEGVPCIRGRRPACDVGVPCIRARRRKGETSFALTEDPPVPPETLQVPHVDPPVPPETLHVPHVDPPVSPEALHDGAVQHLGLISGGSGCPPECDSPVSSALEHRADEPPDPEDWMV